MTYPIDIFHETSTTPPVNDNKIKHWIQQTLKSENQQGVLAVMIVEKNEIQNLNSQFRKKDKATNVLAFPANIPAEIQQEQPMLGDIIICPDVLYEESVAQDKALEFHWAHIVTHGVLHLLGYDHILENDALIMQAREIALLEQFGFDNPYDLGEADE